MKTAHVIIGANFGDEAKGKTVDAIVERTIAQGKKVVVCRFNGGGQAGHTVMVDDTRHVFSHVGAGALRGAPTFLSRHFVSNFFVLKKELDELKLKNVDAKVFMHPQSRVTLLSDMLINTILESRRGNARHGSCGLGINETVTRSLADKGKYALTAFNVLTAAQQQNGVIELASKIQMIYSEWVTARIREMCIDKDDTREELAKISSRASIECQAQAMIDMVRDGSVTITTPEEIFADYAVVFEGAQGLMLDEFLGFFPHVTRSCTGLPNAIEAAHEFGIRELVPIYTTRAYLTRHGAGPLSHEGESFAQNMNIIDETNIINQWQGQIRFAPLNLKMLNNFISNDIRRANITSPEYHIHISSPQIALHCLDQIGDFARVYDGYGDAIVVATGDLADFISSETGLPVTITSDGPSSKSVYFSQN